MLGATATMLYGLNIIMDPVHEELEMEPDAPGITKVWISRLLRSVLTPSLCQQAALFTGKCISLTGRNSSIAPPRRMHQCKPLLAVLL